MQKEWVLQFPERKNFLSLHSVICYALTIIQRLSQCLPSPESSGFLNCCSLPEAPRRLSVTMPPSPESPSFINWCSLPANSKDVISLLYYLWELSGDWPRGLTWSFGHSGELTIHPVSPAGAQPYGEHWLEKEPGILSGGAPPHLSQGSFTAAWWSHQSRGSGGWHGWNLPETSRNVPESSDPGTKHHIWKVGELRFIMLVGPEELTHQARSPEQRDYRVFIDRL